MPNFFSKTILTSIAVIITNATALCQHDSFTIQSSFLQEDLEIWVKTPPEYTKTTSSFPIMLVLDANGLFEIAANLNSYLSLSYVEHMPAMITAGIRSKSGAWRAKNFMPDSVSADHSANQFMNFIELELFPQLEKKYRVDDFRLLVGHSLGGLFVTHTLAEKPELFNAYIAISPTLNRHFNYLTKRIEKLQLKKPTFYALSVAEHDLKNYLLNAEKLRDRLAAFSIQNLRWSYFFSPENDHYMVGPPALYKSLQEIFKPWFLNDPMQPTSLEQIISHQAAMSTRYGYTVNIEGRLIMLSQSLLGRDNVACKKALDELQKIYPDSPLAARWLTRYYVEVKDKPSALKQLENYIARSKKINPIDQEQIKSLKKDIAEIP